MFVIFLMYLKLFFYNLYDLEFFVFVYDFFFYMILFLCYDIYNYNM